MKTNNICYKILWDWALELSAELLKKNPNEDWIAERIYKMEVVNDLSKDIYKEDLLQESSSLKIIMDTYYKWRKIS